MTRALQLRYDEYLKRVENGKRPSFFGFQTATDSVSIRQGWRNLRSAARNAFCQHNERAPLPVPVEAFVIMHEALSAMWEANMLLIEIVMLAGDRQGSVSLNQLFRLEKHRAMQTVTRDMVKLLQEPALDGFRNFRQMTTYDEEETKLSAKCAHPPAPSAPPFADAVLRGRLSGLIADLARVTSVRDAQEERWRPLRTEILTKPVPAGFALPPPKSAGPLTRPPTEEAADCLQRAQTSARTVEAQRQKWEVACRETTRARAEQKRVESGYADICEWRAVPVAGLHL